MNTRTLCFSLLVALPVLAGGCSNLLSAQLVYTSATWGADYNWGFIVTPTPPGPECTQLTQWNWFSRTAEFSLYYNAAKGSAVVKGLAIVVNGDPDRSARWPRTIPRMSRVVCQYQARVPLKQGSAFPSAVSLNVTAPQFCPVTSSVPVQYIINSTCGYLYAGDPPAESIRQYCVQDYHGVIRDREAMSDDPQCGDTTYSRSYVLKFPDDPADNKKRKATWCAHKTC
eukprot:m51a1_g4486 hypothetical protein (227) ;mRNA; f:282495-283331